MVGGTAKRAQFESARHTREQREPIIEPEQRDDAKISNNERVQAYLDSFAEAASANEERIQEMKCAASSKDDQMAELIARMDVRDHARDEQIRTKDKQIGDLIDKLTSMSTSKHNNNDGNANKHKRGPKRERGVGGGGGGGGDGGKNKNNKKAPSYDMKYKPSDGGAPRINWRQTKKNTNWDWWHVQAWEPSKLYEEDPAKWRIKQAAYKKARQELN